MTPRKTFELPTQLHATAISVAAKAVLIIGASGRGKSALALQLMAYGARLVSDDRCNLFESGGRLCVGRPAQMPQAIEARGIGLLPAKCVDQAGLHLIVDMDQTATERMPLHSKCNIGRFTVPIYAAVHEPHFSAAIFQYLEGVEQ